MTNKVMDAAETCIINIGKHILELDKELKQSRQENEALSNICNKQEKEIDRLTDVVDKKRTQIDSLKRYFTSGNNVPVSLATIKADDFFRIVGD